MADTSATSTDITYTINDSTRDFPRRHVRVHASDDELTALVERGLLVKRDLFDEATLARMAAAIDRLEEQERRHPDGEHLPGNGFYLRALMDKDPVFLDLVRFEPTLSIARALLGPQVWFGVEARIAAAGEAGRLVPWHIHARVVPDPLPPFFCYPHQIHCLLYLDDVGDREGPLCVLPGSHLRHDLAIPAGDASDREGQEIVHAARGDCVLIHCNLWHRTLPTRPGCRRRRVVLFGYQPAWLKSEVRRGVPPRRRPTDELRATGEAELAELLDGFHW